MGTVYLKNVPDQLQRQFKAVCAVKGVSMTQVLKGAMTAVVNGELEIDEESGMVTAGQSKPKKS